MKKNAYKKMYIDHFYTNMVYIGDVYDNYTHTLYPKLQETLITFLLKQLAAYCYKSMPDIQYIQLLDYYTFVHVYAFM